MIIVALFYLFYSCYREVVINRSIKEKFSDDTKNSKENLKVKEDIKPKEAVKPKELDPVLEARRKKFESKSVIEPTNKKIRLASIKDKSTIPKMKEGISPSQKEEDLDTDVPNDELQVLENGGGDILLLHTDYSIDEDKPAKVEPSEKRKRTQDLAPAATPSLRKKISRKKVSLSEGKLF